MTLTLLPADVCRERALAGRVDDDHVRACLAGGHARIHCAFEKVDDGDALRCLRGDDELAVAGKEAHPVRALEVAHFDRARCCVAGEVEHEQRVAESTCDYRTPK
jgi:hypothetical protein